MLGIARHRLRAHREADLALAHAGQVDIQLLRRAIRLVQVERTVFVEPERGVARIAAGDAVAPRALAGQQVEDAVGCGRPGRVLQVRAGVKGTHAKRWL